MAAANPLRGLSNDADHVRQLVASIEGPVDEARYPHALCGLQQVKVSAETAGRGGGGDSDVRAKGDSAPYQQAGASPSCHNSGRKHAGEGGGRGGTGVSEHGTTGRVTAGERGRA